jgi:alpha-tubulin suppressor-like RCC1 family protein
MGFQSHTLFIKNDDSLWGVGINRYGQLGVATNSGKTNANPDPLKVMDGVKMVSSYNNHTLVLKKDNTVWSFGKNRSGELGTTTNNGTDNANPTPKQIMTDAKFVSAGGLHSLVVKNDNSLWGFGNSFYGQLGFIQDTNPAPVKIMDGVSFAIAGENQTYVVKVDGTLWSCGNNFFGQLGHAANYGTNTGYATFTQIADNVKFVYGGFNVTYFIKNDNSLWGMGSDSDNLLLGTGSGYSPRKIMDDVLFVTGGRHHAEVIKTDKTLWTFGKNDYGQLGHTDNLGTQTNNNPKQVASNVRTAIGGFEQVVYITNDSGFWGFGYNYDGELGCTYQNGVVKADATHLRTIDDVKSVMSDCGFDAFNGARDAVALINGLQIEPANPTVIFGDTLQLSAKATFSNGSFADVTKITTWTSQYTIIAPVDAYGVVTGNANGTTKITGTHRGKTASTNVTVANTAPPPKTLTRVIVSPTAITLNVGETKQLTATAEYSDGSTQDITNSAVWTIADQSIASVSSNGQLTARSAGSTTVTASFNGQSATMAATINMPAKLVLIEVAYSNDGVNFSSWQVLNPSNPPQGRYVKFRATLQAQAGGASKTDLNFNQSNPQNTFALGDNAVADGQLKFKTSYTNVMANEGPAGVGTILSAEIDKTLFKSIEKVRVN